MLSYGSFMPNTKSAKKAVRSSNRKNEHNLLWKKKIRDALRALKGGIDDKEPVDLLEKKLISLQKVLDKASKEKVIHKNKANRVKSIYAGKVSALFRSSAKTKKETKSGK